MTFDAERMKEKTSSFWLWPQSGQHASPPQGCFVGEGVDFSRQCAAVWRGVCAARVCAARVGAAEKIDVAAKSSAIHSAPMRRRFVDRGVLARAAIFSQSPNLRLAGHGARRGAATAPNLNIGNIPKSVEQRRRPGQRAHFRALLRRRNSRRASGNGLVMRIERRMPAIGLDGGDAVKSRETFDDIGRKPLLLGRQPSGKRLGMGFRNAEPFERGAVP